MVKIKLTPLRAIRKHCLECSGGSVREVKLCVIPRCPLFIYRLGRNPSRKGMGKIENLHLRGKKKAPR